MINRRFFGLATAAAFAAPGRILAETPKTMTADERLWQEGRYLPSYLEALAAAESGERGALEAASQIAALAGDERAALEMASRMPAGRPEGVSLEGAAAENALDAICRAAMGAQIVILNEAHHMSAHRAFGAEVARALRPLGFNVLAAEAFAAPRRETAFTVRTFEPGAPFTSRLGYYTLDPVFAELAREAASLGYRLADYEQRWDQRAPAEASWEIDIATRETAQAENFVRNVLDVDPSARALVLCGFSHVMEQPGLGGTWFAARLKGMTGIDPLTIEQSDNWPRATAEQDPPHVRAVLERFAPEAPITVQDMNGAVTSRTFRGKVDLSVYHPRTQTVSGRSSWLAGWPGRRAVRVDFEPRSDLHIIQALRVSEGWGSVPADQLPIAPGESHATFFLPPGEYVVRQDLPDCARLIGSLAVSDST